MDATKFINRAVQADDITEDWVLDGLEIAIVYDKEEKDSTFMDLCAGHWLGLIQTCLEEEPRLLFEALKKSSAARKYLRDVVQEIVDDAPISDLDDWGIRHDYIEEPEFEGFMAGD